MTGNNDGNGQGLPDRSAEKSTKDRILDVSIDLFAQKGFDAVTMQEIADAVGIKKASLYYHFAGKDQILQDILGLPMQQLGNIGPPEMGTEEGIVAMGVDKFFTAARDVVLTWMDAPYVEKVLRIMFVEMYHSDQIKKFYSKFAQDALVFWEQNFTIMIKNKLIRPMDPKVLTEEYLSFYTHAWMNYFLYQYGTVGSFRQEYQGRIDNHTAFIISSIKA